MIDVNNDKIIDSKLISKAYYRCFVSLLHINQSDSVSAALWYAEQLRTIDRQLWKASVQKKLPSNSAPPPHDKDVYMTVIKHITSGLIGVFQLQSESDSGVTMPSVESNMLKEEGKQLFIEKKYADAKTKYFTSLWSRDSNSLCADILRNESTCYLHLDDWLMCCVFAICSFVLVSKSEKNILSIS
jgi:hypothetical protein